MKCPRCGLDTREFISAYRDGGDCPRCVVACLMVSEVASGD